MILFKISNFDDDEKAESNPHIEKIRNENSKLKSEVKELNERLHKTQVDLESAKRGSLEDQHSLRKNDLSEESPRRVTTHLVKSAVPNGGDHQNDTNDAIRVSF